jgi:hypothetical protein
MSSKPSNGIPFGDPRNPWRATTEHCRKAGKLGKVKSPWNKWAPGLFSPSKRKTGG